MQILLLSPYHGGSHRAWAEGYQRASVHDVQLLTLPAHFWKWRMHGGAVTLAREWQARRMPAPSLLMATDLLDLTTFLALTRPRLSALPVALYMHENQLTYPLPDDPTKGPMRRQLGERDRHYAFINYVSMLAADRIYFNSRYHRDTFFDALPPFLRHYPEYNELDTVEMLRARSAVLPVGVDLARLGSALPASPAGTPPLLLWNQRLEFDKNPEQFMGVLTQLAAEGLAFRVAFCGERLGKPDETWTNGLAALGDRVVFDGYANEDEYRHWLWQADVTFSTAAHEYFGISILEAAYAHTLPFLPARLSYPEIIPPTFHDDCLYRGRADLLARLRWALGDPAAARALAGRLAAAVAGYDWSAMAVAYDRTLEELSGQ